MKFYLSFLTYGLWFGVMALHALLCLLVTLCRTVTRLPFFSAQVYLCLVSNIACYVVAQTASATIYAYVERLGGVLVYGLMTLFLWREVYLRTFGPRIALPDWVPPRVILYTALLYIAVLATAIALPDHWIIKTLAPLDLTGRAALGIIAAASLVLIVYSFHLGISWDRPTLAITAGLAFSSIFDLAAGYIRHALSYTGASILRNAVMLTYLVTLAVWVWAVLKEKEVEVEPLTPETVAEVKNEMDNIARIARAWILHKESNS